MTRLPGMGCTLPLRSAGLTTLVRFRDSHSISTSSMANTDTPLPYVAQTCPHCLFSMAPQLLPSQHRAQRRPGRSTSPRQQHSYKPQCCVVVGINPSTLFTISLRLYRTCSETMPAVTSVLPSSDSKPQCVAALPELVSSFFAL